MHSCSEQGRGTTEGGVSSGPETEAKNSGKGRTGGSFLSLLIKLKCNYSALESLPWFQVLGYNGIHNVDLGRIFKVVFSPILVMGQLCTGLVPAFI